MHCLGVENTRSAVYAGRVVVVGVEGTLFSDDYSMSIATTSPLNPTRYDYGERCGVCWVLALVDIELRVKRKIHDISNKL